jgi:hypothetical protein
MSAHKGIIASYQCEVTVDHSQFYLEARDRERGEIGNDLDLLYNADTFARHLGVAPGVLSVFTPRSYGSVPLEIHVRDSAPTDEDVTAWDHVVEASLELASGCLVAYGPESVLSRPPGITVPTGMYRVRVYWGGIEMVNENTREGPDHYRVDLWLAAYREPTLLHAGIPNPW